jgi:DNA-binding CsgD family transcriptional regulator
MITIDVLDGAHRRTVSVDGDLIRVGRDASCEVELPGDLTVSRVHALIKLDGGELSIEDLGSRNGTVLNGRPLAGRAPLSPSDRVLIGNFVLVVPEQDAVVETVAADRANPTRARVETGLSGREVEVLRLVCAGQSDQQIADALVLSVKTVHSHLDRIRDKTGCRRRAELVRFALDHGVA